MATIEEDDKLVRAVADAAHRQTVGNPVPDSVVSILNAAAMQRESHRRRELASQAEAIAGNITAVARVTLRAIFGLPA